MARLSRRGTSRIRLPGPHSFWWERENNSSALTPEKPLSKVRSLARGIRRGATADGFTVEEVDRSVVEEEGFRAALDCDVLFSYVDRPWPRAALNFGAYSHL